MSTEDVTAEREGLVEEIADILRIHMTMGADRRYVVTYGITPEDFADALADLLAARDRRVRSVAEDIAYEHAATIDGEFGCCHDEAELRAGGRAPAFDGDEFDPLPEDCNGKRILDRHLAAIHAASEADA